MNIFLTGEKQVGKSTLLSRVLRVLCERNVSVAGFKTLPYYSGNERTGFYIQSLIDSQPDPEKTLISRKISADLWQPVIETFENTGVQILKDSLDMQPDVILMDELGFLENEASNFQKYVKLCLDSGILVIGTLKPLHTQFLDSVRSREDVRVIEVTPENREKAYDVLLNQIFAGLQKTVHYETRGI